MKTYIINLKRSPERRKAIEKACQEIGIKYTIIDAVDGKEMSEEEFEWYRNGRPEMKPTEAACMLSHNKAYTQIVQDKTDVALVLEDDVLLEEPELPSLLQKIIPLHQEHQITLLTYYWCKPGQLELTPLKTINGGRQDYFYCKPHQVWGVGRAAAYILTQSIAQKILNYHQGKALCNADSWVVYQNEGLIEDIRCLFPLPIVENTRFGSDIGYVKSGLSSTIKGIIEWAIQANIPFVKPYMMKRRKQFAERFMNITIKQ